MMNRGLYIHIPFCNKICSYCDFTKRVSNKYIKAKYVDALLKELELYKELNFDFNSLKTIYIGGGTPSSLDLNLLKKLFVFLSSLIDLRKLEEFNFEINPEDLNNELIDLLSSYNVTRVSIGIQTLNKDLLKLLNRSFDLTKFKDSLKYLKNKICHVNIDLMYAIPGQTIQDLETTINEVLSWGIDHVSLYSLILEDKTVFHHLFQNGKISLVDEELELEMVDKINKLLFPTFKKYEVSNYALNGAVSKHNLLYWKNEKYLGVGISSASYLDNYRYTNTNDLKEYFSLIEKNVLPITEIEKLELIDEKKYHLILGFRLIEGIDVNDYYERFNNNIFDDFPKLYDFIEHGYMAFIDNKIFINEEYFYVMNHLLEQLI